MTKPTPRANDQTAGAAWERNELSDEQLEDVRGGAELLKGSLTDREVATPSLNPGSSNGNGFIMRDTIIIRTGG
jgi:hypothetical protein